MSRRLRIGRQLWVLLHRWLGLAMAGFLLLVGLTGSLLAYNSELERYFAPQLYAQPPPGAMRLSLAALAQAASADLPQWSVIGVSLSDERQVSVMHEQPQPPPRSWFQAERYTEVFLDPWTGQELGRRARGDLSEGLVNLMPFIYNLHWRLVLGAFGQWTLGIIALLWTLDCFIAFYLTLPRGWQGFWRRWKASWRIKRGAHFIRLNFDWHRASGLWLWPMLLVFAWSSVMMNIRPVFNPPMHALFDYAPDTLFSQLRAAPTPPRLDWQAAERRGQELMRRLAAEKGFTVGPALSLMYFAAPGVYLYEVRGSHDLFERAPKGGGTYVAFDGDSGALRELVQPTGEHLGNTLESWLYALHMARVFGWPYQLFVCVLGVLLCLLSLSGVLIWLAKRRGRRLRPSAAALAPALTKKV